MNAILNYLPMIESTLQLLLLAISAVIGGAIAWAYLAARLRAAED